MSITRFPCDPIETNCYVYQKGATAVVIDPGYNSFDSLQKFPLQAILLTHSHWDHIAGVARLKKERGLPVYVHEFDSENVKKPGTDGLPIFFQVEGAEVDFFVQDEVRLGEITFRVIHTPGHSPGGVCYYDQEAGILFSGDTLFRGGFGKVSFPTSSPSAMRESLKKLAALPKDTIVYPGHGMETTIGDEL